MDIKQYYSILNYRTYISLILAIIITYFYYYFDIKFHLDLTLLSIAIIFPLVFTIRSSFRRREKALEHLSEFRSSIKTLHYFFMSNERLQEEQKSAIKNILFEINSSTISELGNKKIDFNHIDKILNKILEFISENDEAMPRNVRDKVFRYMKDLHESIENVFAIHSHRTPISLKAYCEIFIYMFPIIFAPTIIYNIGISNSQWVTYLIVLLIQFILISLYNIQNQLEYPFDNIGLDDIKLDHFKIDR